MDFVLLKGCLVWILFVCGWSFCVLLSLRDVLWRLVFACMMAVDFACRKAVDFACRKVVGFVCGKVVGLLVERLWALFC